MSWVAKVCEKSLRNTELQDPPPPLRPPTPTVDHHQQPEEVRGSLTVDALTPIPRSEDTIKGKLTPQQPPPTHPPPFRTCEMDMYQLFTRQKVRKPPILEGMYPSPSSKKKKPHFCSETAPIFTLIFNGSKKSESTLDPRHWASPGHGEFSSCYQSWIQVTSIKDAGGGGVGGQGGGRDVIDPFMRWQQAWH